MSATAEDQIAIETLEKIDALTAKETPTTKKIVREAKLIAIRIGLHRFADVVLANLQAEP